MLRYRGKALRACYERGRSAFAKGEPVDAMPYKYLRSAHGRVDLSPAQRAWLDGWHSAKDKETR